VTGRGVFLDDIALPEMLHAAMLRSDHAHARIKSLDVSMAQNELGVVVVLTSTNILGILDDLPSRPMAGERMVEEMNPPTHPVLAKDTVCYVGQPIAIVVAQDRYLAENALEQIFVEYEMLPVVLDPAEAVKDDSPVIHVKIGANVAIRGCQGGGDVEAAFAHAEHVVRQKHDSQRIAPAPLDTRGIVSDYQVHGDKPTVWNST
jgi:carbon-monoxide dehydrogenase large subunit